MSQIIVFILGLVLGGVVVFLILWGKSNVVAEKAGEYKNRKGSEKLEEFNKGREEEKEANKQKILELVNSAGKATNDEAQKLLGVSDATAERYLDELEKEGKIKQVGQAGRYTHYQK